MKSRIKTKTIYLAGKITGDPNYREKFADVQQFFEEEGYVVLSPAILPPKGFKYQAYMRMTEAMLAECDAVCMLPDFEDSNGAEREFEIAKALGKEIIIMKRCDNL